PADEGRGAAERRAPARRALRGDGSQALARVLAWRGTGTRRGRRRASCDRGGDRGADEAHLRGGGGREMSGGIDPNELLGQAMKMQEELQRLQEEAAQEQVTASAGGGAVKVTATAGGEILKIEIDPKAIDPDDPELLGDVVTAAVNQALRDGRALI